MPPLRILHVTPYAAGAWAYGGIPRLTDSLTRALARRGHHVTVCTTDACDAGSRLAPPAGPGRRLGAWPPIRTSDGVELRVFPNLSNRAAYHWQAFAPVSLGGYLERHAGSFDVAHLHACRNLPGVIAARHLRRAGVPYVLAPNGTAPRLERRLVAKRVFDAIFGQRVLGGAARFAAVSEAERRQLAGLGIADELIALVPNPVDLEEFEGGPVHGRFRRRFNLGSTPIVLFLGKLTPRKRVDALVRAFARLGPVGAQLVIAGNDMGAGRAARTLAATLGLAARTTFTGLLRGSERLEALADADVVVYPSQDEIFGLVPIEALLSGTPVIVSDDSGCGEVIRTTGGGLVVPPGDVGRLSAAIDVMLGGPEHWRRAAASAAASARTLYGSPVVAEATEQMYRRVIAGQAESRPAATAPRAAARSSLPGVSFVVPVRNGAAWLRRVIASIRAQADNRPIEIIAVNDGSTDESAAILTELAESGPLRVLEGHGRGAAPAINLGARAARHPIVAQVDQDVVLEPGWLTRLAAELDDPLVAAAQGYYVTDRAAPVSARVTGLDVEDRYAAIAGRETTHVCTGNAVYRKSALFETGLFDEALGYGYDNDMSYRLRAGGHRLVFCREARSVHHWRHGLRGYSRQQYGFGYGRLDLVAKHPRRATGDDVSRTLMMAHPAVMALAVAALAASGLISLAGGPWMVVAATGLTLVAMLATERAWAGVRCFRRSGDPAALLFPVVHLYRDLVWVTATVRWGLRRLLGQQQDPSHSMRPHASPDAAGSRPAPTIAPRPLDATDRVLGLIPAHNEADSLPSVITSLRRHCPDLDVLVIDDGSTDGTGDVLERLGVPWLRFPERMGIGSAMRAGLRYASRLGYRAAVRLDGDGQHGADQLDRILGPIRRGEADVALGSRFSSAGASRPGLVGLTQRALAACLSKLTGARVTDPTSGFCALGPRAVRVLSEHHPTGYPEPELRLFLNRNRLTAVEVPVAFGPRLGGRSSLTPGRLTLAGARVLLALVIAPHQSIVAGLDHD